MSKVAFVGFGEVNTPAEIILKQCTDAEKAEEFYHLAECVSKLYAQQEDFEAAAKKLFSGKKYAYYETQWYYYCFSETETGLFFSIESKRLAPAKEERLTLKENENLISR